MWLVTGATGHIGNVLIRKLIERGGKVLVLILPNECRDSLDGLQVEAVEGDVLNVDSLFKAMCGVKGVFHLAGVISIMPGADKLVRRVNIYGKYDRAKAKATHELGYQPRPLYESIRDAVKWFLEKKSIDQPPDTQSSLNLVISVISAADG